MSSVDRADLQFNKGFFYGLQAVVSERNRIGIFLRVMLTTVTNLYPQWLQGYLSFMRIYKEEDLDKWKAFYDDMEVRFGGFIDILRDRLSRENPLGD